MTTALFLGRFQPVPHKGHVQVLQEMFAKHDRILIGLGSSQYSGTQEHPLTAEERREIFEVLFSALAIPHERYQIIPLPDIHDNDQYVAHVASLLPAFETLYSGNELVQRLFAEKGYTVVSVDRYGEYSGTTLREKMKQGDSTYANMIPLALHELVRKWGIADRIRSL